MSTVQAVRERRERRDEVAGAVFALWVVSGLFLDGWAHHQDMAETFWTPWHAVLYSGFVAAGAYATISGWLARRRGEPVMRDRLILFGFGAFLVGGVGDGVWHTIFGVEEDLEALLSPTHLLLMIGGLLLTTSAVRAAWVRPERAPSLRTLLPATIGMTLAIAITGFFLHFASPFTPEPETYQGAPSDTVVGLAVMSVIVTTVLLMGAAFVLRARWELPSGTLLVMFTGFALLMTGLHGFAQVAVVLPAVLAGALADGMFRARVSPRLIGAVVPTVLWSAWFATYGAMWGLDWTPELWGGAIVFGGLTGLALSFLAQPAGLPESPPAEQAAADTALQAAGSAPEI